MSNPLHILVRALRDVRSEKRIRQVTLRLSQPVLEVIDELADRAGVDRADYLARQIEAHALGNAPSTMFKDSSLDVHQFRASREGAGDRV